ncbi:hypothetical protein ACTHOQ_03040 [Solibacillus silvestris]|uniref:hypothetical protein n=1 Tax=Solibacillus silvestris TaxID=76853 RepID=UPI003F7F4401
MSTIIRISLVLIVSNLLIAPHSYAMIGEKGQALQFHYEIIEQNGKTFWNLQHEDQFMQIKQSEKSHEALLLFKDIVEQTNSKLLPLIMYSCYILFFIVFAIFFTLTKPNRLKHPLFILSAVVSCLFLFKIYSYYAAIQSSEANLRYYYLLLENINSPQ